ncbi:MAG: hypothetical protein ACTS73_02925 [Arsenophonus sp. NEOnobi-MAG3]
MLRQDAEWRLLNRQGVMSWCWSITAICHSKLYRTAIDDLEIKVPKVRKIAAAMEYAPTASWYALI